MQHILRIGITVVVILKALEKHDTRRILIAEQRDCVIHTTLKIAEADNIAKGFDRVQNPVRAGKRLNQAMHFQILIHPQGIQRGGVESSQEHIDHD